ncbi:hypothetical protein [Nocardia arthritidis]|uniref:Uncharacterized protein n=1 Tax=Nocardia arthritidis TaxID=228602 RepID=A0A6G9Y7L3_9NOCA|nr:hypothetical protein [Nocardia arthritidis]QIS09201.1 hypothetical protein F5544_06450 [Nocardia arthritidis]
MTPTSIERRIESLEIRVTDLEDLIDETQHELLRRVTRIELFARRSTDQLNGIGRALTAIADHFGIPQTPIPEVIYPTEAEIDNAMAERW